MCIPTATPDFGSKIRDPTEDALVMLVSYSIISVWSMEVKSVGGVHRIKVWSLLHTMS
jgi:hypothetical protein